MKRAWIADIMCRLQVPVAGLTPLESCVQAGHQFLSFSIFE